MSNLSFITENIDIKHDGIPLTITISKMANKIDAKITRVIIRGQGVYLEWDSRCDETLQNFLKCIHPKIVDKI